MNTLVIFCLEFSAGSNQNFKFSCRFDEFLPLPDGMSYNTGISFIPKSIKKRKGTKECKTITGKVNIRNSSFLFPTLSLYVVNKYVYHEENASAIKELMLKNGWQLVVAE